tara:strand:+ start:225 stop:683 length:459 start_codon:yes stop_codon:yes gene_type:complete
MENEMDLTGLLNGVTPAAEQKENKALPDGHYNVVIEKIEAKHNKQTDAKGISLQMRVFGVEHNNRVIFDYMLIAGSEAGLKYSLPKLKKLGELFQSENTQNWAGKKVNVNVSVDNKDATRNMVWSYQSVADVGEEPSNNSAQSTITADSLPF